MWMHRRDGGSVIAGEKDEGVVAHAQFVERTDQCREAMVQLGDVAVVSRIAGVIGWIPCAKFRR